MKSVLLVAAFAVAINPLFAQKIKVTESNEQIGGGSHPVLTVSVYQASAEQVEKELKSMMKDYDAKVSPQDGGLFGDNATIKKISKNTIDIYGKWEKASENEIRVTFAFDLGGAFLSSNLSDEFKAAKDVVREFAEKTTNEAFILLVKAEEKTFDVLNNEQKKLEKENKNLNDDIADYKQKIEDYNQKIKKAQEDIELNNRNQGTKKEEIDRQQKVLMAARDKQKSVD